MSNLNRELRSFLVPRDPSVDRRCRPPPEKKKRLFETSEEISEENSYDGTKFLE